MLGVEEGDLPRRREGRFVQQKCHTFTFFLLILFIIVLS